MKIVSWNCNGGFRKKFEAIKELDADIYVIQECENPELTKNKAYKEFSKNSFWISKDKNKGLGVFAKDNISLKPKDWDNYGLKYFLPININNTFDLIAVWAHNPGHIEEYFVYQNIYFNHFNKNTIIIGDFNSSAIWDDKHKERCHTAVVNKLLEKDIKSVYHCLNDEEQGKETVPTFYMYRHIDKGYHIDYCFTNTDKVKEFQIGDPDKWLQYSDHMPLIVTI